MTATEDGAIVAAAEDQYENVVTEIREAMERLEHSNDVNGFEAPELDALARAVYAQIAPRLYPDPAGGVLVDPAGLREFFARLGTQFLSADTRGGQAEARLRAAMEVKPS